MTTRHIRSFALIGAVALVLTACGGEDAEPVPDTGDEVTFDTRPAVDPPEATVAPNLPGALNGHVGPVDVDGVPLPPYLDETNDISIGLPAPVLAGLDTEQRPIRIDPAEDGPTMLVFLAHWCPACNDEVPNLVRMRSYGQFPDDLNIVGVLTAQSPDRPNFPPGTWIRDKMNWKYPTMLDGVDPDTGASIASTTYGLTAYPFVVLVDGDGMVVDRWSGGRTTEEIVARIGRLGLT